MQDVSTNGTYLNGKRLPRPPFKNPADWAHLRVQRVVCCSQMWLAGLGIFFTHLSASFDLCRTPECDFSMGMNCSSSAYLKFQVDFIGFCMIFLSHWALQATNWWRGGVGLRSDLTDIWQLGLYSGLRGLQGKVWPSPMSPHVHLQYAYCGSFSTPRLSLYIIVYMNVVHHAYYAYLYIIHDVHTVYSEIILLYTHTIYIIYVSKNIYHIILCSGKARDNFDAVVLRWSICWS